MDARAGAQRGLDGAESEEPSETVALGGVGALVGEAPVSVHAAPEDRDDNDQGEDRNAQAGENDVQQGASEAARRRGGSYRAGVERRPQMNCKAARRKKPNA